MALENLSLADAPEPEWQGIEILPDNLETINLNGELLANYAAIKRFLNEIDPDTPANQVAQVHNSMNAALEKLIKMQEQVYNIERLKKIEQAVVDCMRKCPENVQDMFFKEYERMAPK